MVIAVASLRQKETRCEAQKKKTPRNNTQLNLEGQKYRGNLEIPLQVDLMLVYSLILLLTLLWDFQSRKFYLCLKLQMVDRK